MAKRGLGSRRLSGCVCGVRAERWTQLSSAQQAGQADGCGDREPPLTEAAAAEGGEERHGSVLGHCGNQRVGVRGAGQELGPAQRGVATGHSSLPHRWADGITGRSMGQRRWQRRDELHSMHQARRAPGQVLQTSMQQLHASINPQPNLHGAGMGEGANLGGLLRHPCAASLAVDKEGYLSDTSAERGGAGGTTYTTVISVLSARRLSCLVV